MKQTMPLCAKCADDLIRSGYELTVVTLDASKITCGVCGRQTWGHAYHIAKGEQKGGKK